MKNQIEYLTPVRTMTKELLLAIANANWRPFDKADFDGFAGVQNADDALICDDDEIPGWTGYVLILDGDYLTAVGPDGDERRWWFNFESQDLEI